MVANAEPSDLPQQQGGAKKRVGSISSQLKAMTKYSMVASIGNLQVGQGKRAPAPLHKGGKDAGGHNKSRRGEAFAARRG